MDDRCASCGAGLAPGAAWCGQCYAAVASTATAPSAQVGSASTPPLLATPTSAPYVPGRVAPVEAPRAPLRTTRWGKTPTTFGPMGRSLATFALLVPLALMIVGGLGDPFAWGGAGVWAGIVMPMALRDIWKAGQVPVA